MSDTATAPHNTRNGACLCENIRVEVIGDPSVSMLCHCANCKKASGSAFQANLFFKQDQVKVVDEQKFLRTFIDTKVASGSTVHRLFCGNCGSTIGATKPEMGLMAVASGIVEDTTGWRPVKEFFCSNRIEWLPEIPGAEKRTAM